MLLIFIPKGIQRGLLKVIRQGKQGQSCLRVVADASATPVLTVGPPLCPGMEQERDIRAAGRLGPGLSCRAEARVEGRAGMWTPPLSLQMPAEQRDPELPQLPPLVHEAWLCVTSRSPAGLCPSPPLGLRSPFTPVLAHRCSSGPSRPPASLYFALYRKINCLYLGPVILTFPAQGMRGGGKGGSLPPCTAFPQPPPRTSTGGPAENVGATGKRR